MKNSQVNLPTEKNISRRYKFLLIITVFLMVTLFFVSRNVFTGLTQTKDRDEKMITKETFKNEPIEILEIKSNAKTVELKEKFIQENDWLEDFTIKFKNISGKPIIHISTVISFPETNSTGKRMSHFVKYGVNPLVKSSADTPALLAPNNTAELKLSTEKFTRLKNFLATRQYSLKDLTEAHLTIMAVYFEDGTLWSSGAYYRPDPDKEGKFIPVGDASQEEEK